MLGGEKVPWSLRRGHQTAEAVFVQVPEIGLGLRFIWNGELAHSQVYRDTSDLQRVTQEKRRELEARGWDLQPPTS
jgi:hypothetical protein